MSCALVATREEEISGAARKIAAHFAVCARIKPPRRRADSRCDLEPRFRRGTSGATLRCQFTQEMLTSLALSSLREESTLRRETPGVRVLAHSAKNLSGSFQ